MKPKAIGILIIMVLFLIILFQNIEIGSWRLFFWEVRVPRILPLLAMFFLGFVIGAIFQRDRP
ncbi:hypothetical protein KGY73_01380 [bacterium]|nr:hypothetical protein [bacterium]